MARTDLFLKVEIVHDDRDTPEKLAAEICRRILKIYGVRSAEMSHFISHEKAAEE